MQQNRPMQMKKRILIAYYSMIVGGSTTSLLALLGNLDTNRYEIDLQLQRNLGPLLDQIPAYVHLLPPAEKYTGRVGKLIKIAVGMLTGKIPKAWFANRHSGKAGLSGQVLADLNACRLSRGNPKEYDIAIGFLEGWPVRYVAHQIRAKKKLGWLHSTFANLAPIPELEKSWMEKVDHIVFVADDCRDAFKETMPEFAAKAVTIHNIVDSDLLRARAEKADEMDSDYIRFRDADCFKLVTVCRVNIAVKGLDRAVACARQLKDLGKKFLWAIVGDGEDLEKLQQMIAETGLTDCMMTVGNRMNPLPFVKAADVFCMLSRYEGKPMVITESMILGTPPVVTRYLSAGEQIRDGVEGIIVENTEASALPVLLRCMDEPKLVQSMRDILVQNDYGNRSYIQTIEQNYFS